MDMAETVEHDEADVSAADLTHLVTEESARAAEADARAVTESARAAEADARAVEAEREVERLRRKLRELGAKSKTRCCSQGVPVVERYRLSKIIPSWEESRSVQNAGQK